MIFGTLLERALGPEERHQLGAARAVAIFGLLYVQRGRSTEHSLYVPGIQASGATGRNGIRDDLIRDRRRSQPSDGFMRDDHCRGNATSTGPKTCIHQLLSVVKGCAVQGSNL